MKTPITILLVDDHKVVADAIGSLLDATEDMTVVDRVYETDQIIPALRRHHPDILICDLEMPGGDPLEAAAEGLAHAPNTRIVVLTAYPTDARIEHAMQLRVAGFLTKNEPAETIADGIRAVAKGHAVYSDEVRARFASGRNAESGPRILALSPREITVTRLVAQGMTSQQIAKTLYRSAKTVDKQIASAMAKTGCSNRVDLSRWAIREGLAQA